MRMRSTASSNPAIVRNTSSTCCSSPVAQTTATTTASGAASALAAARKRNLRIVTRVPKFLRCLYDILHNEDPSILGWASDGAFFQIFDTKRLEATVLPKYFKHSKFASFQRQLNNFGFRKWTKTQSSVCTFSHHLYVQRHPNDLVELVIEQNEANNREQQDDGDDVAPNSNNSSTIAAMAPVATASPKRSPAKKRKRAVTVDSSDAADFQPYKHHHTQQHASALFAGRELSFQEQLSFHVESWDLLPVANPVAWEYQPLQPLPLARLAHAPHLRHLKHAALGNETPTSAAALNELTFNFTMEELDDILFTTSDPECCAPSALPIAPVASVGFASPDDHLLDLRFLAPAPLPVVAVDTSVAFAPMPPVDTADHADTVKYLHEMFAKPENEFWLPC